MLIFPVRCSLDVFGGVNGQRETKSLNRTCLHEPPELLIYRQSQAGTKIIPA